MFLVLEQETPWVAKASCALTGNWANGGKQRGSIFLHLGKSFIDSLKAVQIKRKLYSLSVNGRKIDHNTMPYCIV
jgi:hypothetical protein